MRKRKTGRPVASADPGDGIPSIYPLVRDHKRALVRLEGIHARVLHEAMRRQRANQFGTALRGYVEAAVWEHAIALQWLGGVQCCMAAAVESALRGGRHRLAKRLGVLVNTKWDELVATTIENQLGMSASAFEKLRDREAGTRASRGVGGRRTRR